MKIVNIGLVIYILQNIFICVPYIYTGLEQNGGE